jgi:proteasome assembly chaperone (PAC2) family protein
MEKRLDIHMVEAMPKCWVNILEKLTLDHATAVAASPGLRSVGWLVLKYLVKKLNPRLIAKIYSTSFPVLYETLPSYSPHPAASGVGGIFVNLGMMTEPSVEVHLHNNLLLVTGYQANFHGQREVAEETIRLLKNMGINFLIALAAHAMSEEDFYIAATKSELVEKYCQIFKAKPYQGPILGFTGLILGEAVISGLDGICILSKTTPNPEFPEHPDYEAAKKLAKALLTLLKIELEPTDLKEVTQREYNSRAHLPSILPIGLT